MDPNSLDTLKTNAQDAAGKASDMAMSAPGLLSQLKQNLVNIFSTDNPVLKARDTALSDYLATPSKTRADILSGNLPEVLPGRQLTLSPTQQQSIVDSRSAAAFAPLAGLNEIIKAQFGNIGDVVNNAGGIYSTQVTAANNNANNLLDLYKTAISQYAAQNSGATSGGVDLGAILSAISKSLGVGAPTTADPNAIADQIYGTAPAQTPAAPASNGQNWQQDLITSLGLGGLFGYNNPQTPQVPRGTTLDDLVRQLNVPANSGTTLSTGSGNIKLPLTL